MVQSGVAAGAEVAAAVGVLGIAFDLDQASFFDITDRAADGAAELAHAGNLGDVFVLVDVRPVSFRLGTGKSTDARSSALFVGLALDAIPLLHVDALFGAFGSGAIRVLLARVGTTRTNGCGNGSNARGKSQLKEFAPLVLRGIGCWRLGVFVPCVHKWSL